jgi:hypothetical protein
MNLGDFFPDSFKEEFARKNLQIGSVLKLHIKDTNPAKEKRFTVVGKTTDGLCLATVFINSEINPFINFSPELQQLHCFFKANGREYLDHDSYVNCSTIYIRNHDELHEALEGLLNESDLQIIRSKIVSSPKIKGRDKKRFGFYPA